MIIKYLCSIVIPLAIIILEKNGKPLPELWNLFLAALMVYMENEEKAKKILVELTYKFPNNHKSHQMLAQLYEKEGATRKAIDEYVQAIELNKQDYDSYFKVAYLLKDLNKSDEAMQMLQNLVRKRPEYCKASELLGEILIEKEMYKEAVNIYQDALRQNPGSYELNYNLGIAYTMLNDFQNAKQCYEKAAEINALSYNSKYSIAEIEMMYKNLDEAEQMFLKVIEDDELSPDAYFELSKIYLIKGDKETAIKYANLAIDLNPKKIAERINNDNIFYPIFARLDLSKAAKSTNKKTSKLKPIELKSKKHLEEMFDITRHLGYNDIQNSNKEKEFNTRNINGREINS